MTSKCARVILMLSGDVAHKCFMGWKDLLSKKRAAVRRWTHSSLIACWGRWATVVEEAVRYLIACAVHDVAIWIVAHGLMGAQGPESSGQRPQVLGSARDAWQLPWLGRTRR